MLGRPSLRQRTVLICWRSFKQAGCCGSRAMLKRFVFSSVVTMGLGDCNTFREVPNVDFDLKLWVAHVYIHAQKHNRRHLCFGPCE